MAYFASRAASSRVIVSVYCFAHQEHLQAAYDELDHVQQSADEGDGVEEDVPPAHSEGEHADNDAPGSMHPENATVSKPSTPPNSQYSSLEWEINYDEIEMQDKIGAGSFGVVYKGKWHGVVAVKKLTVSNPTPEQLRSFKNEVLVLRKTRHRNCLLFMGACTKQPNLAIVTQWCEGNSLNHQIHMTDVRLSKAHKADVACQIAQGVEYLHSKAIIHRDLKSGNILLSSTYKANDRFEKNAPVAQVADFGLAMVKTNWCDATAGPAGSIIWMAPEIITMKAGEDPYSQHSDTFAFGIVLYELFANALPYKGHPIETVMYMVGRGLMRPDLDNLESTTPAAMKDILSECIQREPSTRPNFEDLGRAPLVEHDAPPWRSRCPSCANRWCCRAVERAPVDVHLRSVCTHSPWWRCPVSRVQ
eukprot:m.690240 g.690240  ORF g.690240 m.690240 type:complete len:418 (+) comp22848_c0_seq18:349-1602(+)